MQYFFLDNYGVNVNLESWEIGHTVTPEMSEVILKYLYPNMPDSGYESESDVITTSMNDFSYVENGVLTRFN